jgi:hypothetical protein
MPLPANWNTVTVTATFLKPDSTPASGSVQFVAVRAVGMDDTIVLPHPITAVLNGSGQITASLPCPDDAGAGFTSLVYAVKERTQYGRDAYFIELDNAMTSIELEHLPRVDTVPPQDWYATLEGIAAEAAASAAIAQAYGPDMVDRVAVLEAGQGAGMLGFETKALMDADLAHPEGTLALVTNDATAANNGTYRKTGASGSGSWVQSADRVTALEGRVAAAEEVTEDFLTGYDLSGYAYAVTDAADNVAFGVKSDGTVEASGVGDVGAKVAFASERLFLDTSFDRSGYLWALLDSANNVALGVASNGDLYSKGVNLSAGGDNAAAISAINALITPSTTRIVCWGDSLTESPFAGALATISGRTVTNKGLGGQDAARIVARQGGKGFTLTVSGNSIPASGAVNVTPSVAVLDTSGTVATLVGSVAGITGTLSKSGAQYVFTRAVAGSATPAYPGTPFIVDNASVDYDLAVIWVGRNHFNFSQSAAALTVQIATVKDHIAKAVARLRPLRKRFVILGVTSGDNSFEYTGTDNYNAKRTLAADLAELYPENFIDIDPIMVNSGTGTGQDATDFANGIVPASLRSDSQHHNSAGATIVATAVHNHITARGW